MFKMNTTKAKRRLYEVDVDELALVEEGHEPVHQGAVITFVKAQPAGEVDQKVTKEDLNGFQRVLELLKGAVPATTPTEEVAQTPEELEKAKTAAAAKNVDPEDDANLTPEEKAAAAAKKKKMQKSVVVSEEDLTGLVSALNSLETRVSAFNEDFHIDVEKANAGAAIMKEVRGHVANATAEANKLFAALRATDVPLPEVAAPATIVAPEVVAAPAVETAAPAPVVAATTETPAPVVETPAPVAAPTIAEELAKAFAPFMEKLGTLEAKLEETATVAKEAKSASENAGTDLLTRVNKAISDASVDAARLPDIPLLNDRVPTNTAKLTTQELQSVSFEDAARALLNMQTQ